MARRLALFLLILATTTACSSVRKATQPEDMNASAGASAAAAGATVPLRQAGPDKDAPKLDPKRVVAEQDCSKPVDFFKGNLRCK